MARYDADFFRVVEPQFAAMASQPPSPPMSSVLVLRQQVNEFIRASRAGAAQPDGIVVTRYAVDVAGGRTVSLVRFSTAAQLAAKDQPAVVYCHPGGMVCGSVDLLASSIAGQAKSSGVQHFAVAYTLSPEAVAPTALEECYACLAWVSANAGKLGVNAARIGLCGASAGGGLAAGLGLMARDRRLQPPVAKLVLIYPMLDDRTVQAHPPKGARHAGAKADDDDWPARPFLLWTCEQNALAWAAYLGVGDAKTDGPLEAAAALAVAAEPTGPAIYAVPARVPSLAGLPSTYMDVGGLDLFLEECNQFAARLGHDQVEFEYHAFPGLPHGFEMGPTAKPVETALELRSRALNSF